MATKTKSPEKCLAVIGCGAVVEEAYVPKLKELSERGWVILFVDANSDRARNLAVRFLYASFVPSLDQVVGRASHAIVATPPASHFPICSRLLEAGIHVLCEKPFVLNPAQGYELVKQARTANLKLHINQTRRWFPSGLIAKKMLEEGALGEVTSITIREGNRFSWPTKTAFHSQPNLARHGILSDLGAHIFDLVSWVIGKPLKVIDVKHDGYAGPEATVCVRFSCGQIMGDASITWLLAVPNQMQFIGTKACLTLDDNCNHAFIRTGARDREVVGANRYMGYAEIVADVIEGFLIDVKNPAVATGESVMSSIEFMDQAYTCGKPELPFVTRLGGPSI